MGPWGCKPSEPTFAHAKTQPAHIPVADFALEGDGGQTVRLSDFKGQWVWLFFGFTQCPDICPTTLQELTREYAPVAASKRVRVLFVSVDHQRDKGQDAATYAKHFHQDFVGVAGTKQQVDAATQALGALYQFRPKGKNGYDVDHSGNIYVLDPEGRLVATYGHTGLNGGLAKDFAFLSAESPKVLTVDKAWVRTPPPHAKALAGYLTLKNPRSVPVKVFGGLSPQFDRIEMHETYETEAGLTGMRQVRHYEIPAGGSLSLQPGGKHLMLIGPKKAFQDGDRIDLYLTVTGGETIKVAAPVSTQEPG